MSSLYFSERYADAAQAAAHHATASHFAPSASMIPVAPFIAELERDLRELHGAAPNAHTHVTPNTDPQADVASVDYVDSGEGFERARELLAQGYTNIDVVETDPAAQHQPVRLWRQESDGTLRSFDLDALGNIVVTEHRLRALLQQHTDPNALRDAIADAIGD